MAAELQATPPLQLHPVQAPSPHLLLPQMAPSHLGRPQMSSPACPHPYVTPGLEPQPQLVSPPFAGQPPPSSPHLLSPPHHYNQNHDSDWTRRTELPLHRRSESFLYQVSSPPRTGGKKAQKCFKCNSNLRLQDQNHLIPQQGHLGGVDRLACNTQAPPTGAVYQQPDGLCPVQDACRSLDATLSQLQCSPQASMSSEDNLGRWGLMDFSSSLTEEAFTTQYYHNPAPQPFCSPTTPGPSPQYPQTPTLSSPPMQPWEEPRNVFPQTSGQLSSCGFLEYDAYAGQHPPQQTAQLLMSQYELIQDQAGLFDGPGCSDSGLSPQVMTQEVQDGSPSPSLPAGLSWREDHGRASFLFQKKCPQPKKSTEEVCR